MRLALASALLLAVLAGMPASSQEAGAPSPATAATELSSKHRSWLEEVEPLISPKEKEAFLGLRRDYQRDAFIRRFWEVRDPFPKTARNELAERWEERVRLARERFNGLAGDRARMLLLNGEPPDVFKASCIELLQPLEIWSYPGTDRIRDPFSLVFIQGQGVGGYRLWYPSEGIQSLLALGARVSSPQGIGYETIAQVCTRGEDLAARIGEAIDWAQVESRSPVVPRPSEEWLSTFTSYSTDLPADAKPLPARLDLSFPARYGSRTVVQGLVSVPREAAAVEKLADQGVYSFIIDGEVLRGDELFEHFRYRFTLPSTPARPEETAAATLPIVFQRYLRPGVYTLVLKIEDTAGKSFFREQRQVEVPAVQATAVAVTPSPAGAPAAPATALAEANADVGSDENTVRILPPPPGLLTGRVRLEAMATGEGIARVRFELNGKPVLTKGKPPYSVEVSLGDQPRFHRVTARALAADGSELAEDEVQLNVGPHRFSVRLVEPQQGKSYRESLRAQAQVDVPEGEALDRVELYLNDALVATLYQPPFVQPILLPPGPQEMTYVRTVAYLADGNSAEDLVVVNMPGDFGEQMKVQFVELFTTAVDRRGRPVEGLTREDFKVLEDGVEQEVRRFELVRDQPIYAGIVIDTSASMQEELNEAVEGGLRFFETVLTSKDRAAVVTFSDQPNLAVRFTNEQEILAGGLAGLRAEGETALYDSLIYTLYYFGGLKGKRAVILLSDGADTKSRYQFDDVLEYARRSGVALYTVGINLKSNETDVRIKLERLAEETGGRSFFISGSRELKGVYEKVEAELRSQYLLAYQSSNAGREEKFRAVEVKMAKPGLEAKTMRGYYP